MSRRERATAGPSATMTQRVVVASANPVKIEATRRAFSRLLPEQPVEVVGIDLPSGVAAQPLGDDETRRGAEQRCDAAAALPGTDLAVGIEGGIEETADGMFAFAWVVVRSPTTVGRGRSGAFELPPPIARLIRQGVELGEADDAVFGRRDSKRREGAIGILSGNRIDRAALYEHAVALALLPLRNPELYQR